MASVNSKDQDCQVCYSISLCCCADTDVGFSFFLETGFLPFSMFVLDRTCKKHCSLPIQEQINLGEMERKEKKEHERRAWSLFCDYGTEGLGNP